jgi:hypothetical protein
VANSPVTVAADSNWSHVNGSVDTGALSELGDGDGEDEYVPDADPDVAGSAVAHPARSSVTAAMATTRRRDLSVTLRA